MADLVTLACPSCGGPLRRTAADRDAYVCAHCGQEHLVTRSRGRVSLAPLAEGLRRVQAGVDRTASELAIKRLSAEIQALRLERSGAASVMAEHQWRPAGIGCGAGILLLLVWALIVLSGWRAAAGWFLALALLATLAGVAASIVRRRRSRQEALAALDDRIARKTEELRRHREIVAG
jgi:uncharacterized Zn finger protein (UPF0148 family)